MNIAIFANEIIFPVLLFCVFCYLFIIYPEIQELKTKNLSNLYKTIIQNSCQSELDSISNRKELIDKLIAIALNNGYRITYRDIESSIQQYTQDSQSNYVCLPIGCWRVG